MTARKGKDINIHHSKNTHTKKENEEVKGDMKYDQERRKDI